VAGGFQPDMKNAGIGVGLIAAVAVADLAGQRLLHRAGRPAGRGHHSSASTVPSDAGFNWRCPYPDPAHERSSSRRSARSMWAATT
jgi:membrane protease subunit HflK